MWKKKKHSGCLSSPFPMHSVQNSGFQHAWKLGNLPLSCALNSAVISRPMRYIAAMSGPATETHLVQDHHFAGVNTIFECWRFWACPPICCVQGQRPFFALRVCFSGGSHVVDVFRLQCILKLPRRPSVTLLGKMEREVLENTHCYLPGQGSVGGSTMCTTKHIEVVLGTPLQSQHRRAAWTSGVSKAMGQAHRLLLVLIHRCPKPLLAIVTHFTLTDLSTATFMANHWNVATGSTHSAPARRNCSNWELKAAALRLT